jgi:hypothetical protein
VCYDQLGQYEEAIADFTTCVELATEQVRAHDRVTGVAKNGLQQEQEQGGGVSNGPSGHGPASSIAEIKQR